MLVRTHRNRDIPAISRLYYDTIHRINVQDYSREQVDAWAPEVPGESFWRERFKNYTVYVAEDDGCIVGFTELGTFHVALGLANIIAAGSAGAARSGKAKPVEVVPVAPPSPESRAVGVGFRIRF